MTHLIDGEFVADLTKLAAPLATAIAEAAIAEAFNSALVPLVAKAAAEAAAQAADAQLVAKQAVAAVEASEHIRRNVAAELTKVAADIRAELTQFQPTQGGYAYIKRA